MGAPWVSVVIPSFNRAAGLRRVLEAFERQQPSDLPFEVVAVDDGSEDETSSMLASWRSDRFQLRFARQPVLEVVQRTFPTTVVCIG